MHTDVTVEKKIWKLITPAAVASLACQNLTTSEICLQATSTSAPPTSVKGAQRIVPMDSLLEDILLSVFFGGVGAGPYFVWLWSEVGGDVRVSYA